MLGDWWIKRDKMDVKRQAKLRTKMQKARVMGQREAIEAKPSWNGRFKAVQAARVEVKQR